MDYAATHSTYVPSSQPFQVSSFDKRDMRDPQALGRTIIEMVHEKDYPQMTATQAADLLWREFR